MGFFQAVRSCWALFLGFGIMATSHGLLGSLIGVRLSIEGYETGTAGLVTAGFFLGIVLAALAAPALIERVGHVRVFAAMAALAAVASLLHSLWIDAWFWFALRTVTGFASTALYIVTESWVNARAENAYRGRLLSVYMLVWLLAMAGGQLAIDAADPGGHLLFLFTACGYALSVIPLALATSKAPDYASPTRVSMTVLWRVSPLAVVSAAMVGMIHGALVGMASVYAKAAGYATAEVAWLTAAIYLGGIVLQIPIGRLSDRLERRLVLAAVSFAAAGSGGLALLLGQADYWALVGAIGLLGGLALPLYSLCLALANDRLTQQEMVGASATIYLLVGLGAAVGPPIAGYMMQVLGAWAFFLYLAVLLVAMGLFALYRRRMTAPPEETMTAPPTAPMVPPPGMVEEELAAAAADAQRGSSTV